MKKYHCLIILFLNALACAAEVEDQPIDILVKAIRQNNISRVEQLLDGGAPINGINKRGWTPLLAASKMEYNEAMIELLIIKGADVNQAAGNPHIETPLLAAVTKNTSKLVTQLLASGADPNKGNTTSTPLKKAAMWFQVENVKSLLSAGAHQIISDPFNRELTEIVELWEDKVEAAPTICTLLKKHKKTRGLNMATYLRAREHGAAARAVYRKKIVHKINREKITVTLMRSTQ